IKPAGGIHMGFFAAELEALLQTRIPAHVSPWAILSRLHVHPQQIDRLKNAAADPRQVTALQAKDLQMLCQEVEVTPYEAARLHAAIEADVFLRLLSYHAYPLEDAMNTANAIFAA